MGWLTTIRRNRIDTPIACLAIYALLLHAVIAGVVMQGPAAAGDLHPICTVSAPAGDDVPAGGNSTDDPLCRSLCTLAGALAIPPAPAATGEPDWTVHAPGPALEPRALPAALVSKPGARAPPASA